VACCLGSSVLSKRELEIYEDRYLIPDCSSHFTCNSCDLSKSKHKVPKPVESKLTEVFELITMRA
jgi:hypothetical protein